MELIPLIYLKNRKAVRPAGTNPGWFDEEAAAMRHVFYKKWRDLGWIGITLNDKQQLCRIDLGKRGSSTLSTPVARKIFGELEQRIQMKNGKRKVLKIALPGGTPFQRRVWRALRSIPHGQTRTYRWVAEKIGSPKAARAVGQACGANPLPLYIPCHRVVASGGKTGGFSAGPVWKKRLLSFEKKSLSFCPLLG